MSRPWTRDLRQLSLASNVLGTYDLVLGLRLDVQILASTT